MLARNLFILALLLILVSGCIDQSKGGMILEKVPRDRTSIDDLEPNLRNEVLKGRLVMRDVNLGSNGLSCASCHPNPDLNKVWPALFPRRWSSTLNPEHRIITLAQHNYGAYIGMMNGNMTPDDPSFNALNTYLTWLGDGTLIWSEKLPGEYQLIGSISRGEKLYDDRELGSKGESCNDCHKKRSMEGIVSTYPKYNTEYGEVLILDTYLKNHIVDKQGRDLSLESREISDLSSYLTNMSRGYIISLEKATMVVSG